MLMASAIAPACPKVQDVDWWLGAFRDVLGLRVYVGRTALYQGRVSSGGLGRVLRCLVGR